MPLLIRNISLVSALNHGHLPFRYVYSVRRRYKLLRPCVFSRYMLLPLLPLMFLLLYQKIAIDVATLAPGVAKATIIAVGVSVYIPMKLLYTSGIICA